MSKILVVGDFMLDTYHWGTVERLSPEAPVPVLNVHTTESRPGGAANVAMNLLAMGAAVKLCTVLGRNLPEYKQIVDALGHEPWSAISVTQNTTRKVRGMAGNTQIFRYDHDMVPDPTAADQLNRLVVSMAADFDCIVFSDYGKGALLYIEELLAHCALLGKPTIVDPKGSDWARYSGATYIKPNHTEWMAATNVPEHSVIIETKQAAGACIHQNGPLAENVRGFDVPCIDPTGAGDSFLAQFALCITERCTNVFRAVRRANAAGAIAVQNAGTYIVTKEEVDYAIRSSPPPA